MSTSAVIVMFVMGAVIVGLFVALMSSGGKKEQVAKEKSVEATCDFCGRDILEDEFYADDVRVKETVGSVTLKVKLACCDKCIRSVFHTSDYVRSA